MSSEPALRPEHESLLDWMATTAQRVSNEEFLFVQLNAPTGLYVNLGPPRANLEGHREHADVLVRAGLLDSRINRKGNPEYWLTPEGYAYHDRHIVPVSTWTKVGRWIKEKPRALLTVGVLSLLVAVAALALQVMRP